ncbi:MAG: hypothetical protein PHY43_06145 [Verrucomicrobiales bacterium]|nr:hypothetical protein [Verrucomicrobiales bacterium]
MTEDQLNNARTLWKTVYARDSFRQAQELGTYFLEQKLNEEAPTFYPLLVAIHVLYSRPFMKNYGGVGKLTDDIVPEEYKKLHSETLNFRSWLYAHTDANAPEFDEYGGSANQVRFIRKDGKITHILVTRFKATADAVKNICILCEALQKMTSRHIDNLWSRYLELIPHEDGEYLLNVGGLEQPYVSRAKQFFTT